MSADVDACALKWFCADAVLLRPRGGSQGRPRGLFEGAHCGWPLSPPREPPNNKGGRQRSLPTGVGGSNSRRQGTQGCRTGFDFQKWLDIPNQ